MRFALFFLILTALGACNAPSPHFQDRPAVPVQIGAAQFDVRVKGSLAEALRTNYQYAPRLSGVAPLAVQAMEQVSGCRVARISGDAALMLGELHCDGGPVPTPRPILVRVDCTAVGPKDEEMDWHLIECDPIFYQ